MLKRGRSQTEEWDDMFTADGLRTRFSEVLNRVRWARETIGLARHEKTIAVIVPADDTVLEGLTEEDFYSMAEARNHLSDILSNVGFGNRRFGIKYHDTKVAVIMSPEEYLQLPVPVRSKLVPLDDAKKSLERSQQGRSKYEKRPARGKTPDPS